MIKVQLKKDTIIDAAKTRFAHYGFSKVTMEEIAGDIELSKPSLYYYFPTKDDLFKEVIKSEQDQFVCDISHLLEKKITASEKLSIYAYKRLVYFKDLLNLGTMTVHPNINKGSIYKALFDEFEIKELGLIKGIFEDGKKQNEFDKHIPGNIEHLFLHVLQGLRMRSIKTIKDNSLDESVFDELLIETKKIVDIFIKGILK